MSKPANVVCDPVTGVCRYVPDSEGSVDVGAPAATNSPVAGLLGNTFASKDGSVSVASISGPSKVIGLYFSAHWCPPCRGFTPKLADFYNRFKASHPRKDDLEIIFVSSDRDEESFNKYHAEMPWLALPYEDRDKKNSLSKKFKVQGIPTLVFIDGNTGKTITAGGRDKVSSDPDASGFPWLPVPVLELLAGDLVNAKGETVKGSVALKGKTTLLYFSAHWCPPCRNFTPKLVETYNKLKASGKDVEAVFVSWDRDEHSFKEYLATMPWLAVPFQTDKVKDALGDIYPVPGIPTLIVIDENGKTITTRGRDAVLADPEGLQFPWNPQPLEALTDGNIAQVNDAALLMLVGSGDIQSRATELLESIAVKHLASEQADELFFAYGSADDESVSMLLKFAKITPHADQDTLFLLDIPAQKKFLFDGPALTKEVVANLLDQHFKESLPSEPLGR